MRTWRLPEHLTPDGEGWLILSDLAELAGLRQRGDLASVIASAGLIVRERLDTPAAGRRARARRPGDERLGSDETITLWRLGMPLAGH